jgi:type II secretory pathway component PulJ
MTMPCLRERFLGDERGFTLTEALTSTIIMSFILLALAGLFDASLKVYSFGNNKIEAVESARIGLQKMEREIRQAFQVDSAASQNQLFFTTGSNPPLAMTLPAGTPKVVDQLTFGNDLGGSPEFGNDIIECGSPCEYITYRLTDSAGNSGCTTAAAAPCTLRRVNTSNSADPGEPVVENVSPNGLSFTLLKSDGGIPANEGEIGMVLVKLNVSVNQGIGHAGTQTLTTVVDLRNRQ